MRVESHTSRGRVQADSCAEGRQMANHSRLAAWALLGTSCSLAWACGSSNSSSSNGSPDAAAGDDGSTGSSSGGSGGSGGSSSGSGAGGDSGSGGKDAGPIVAPQPLSPFIVVDQFDYPAAAEKIAVL